MPAYLYRCIPRHSVPRGQIPRGNSAQRQPSDAIDGINHRQQTRDLLLTERKAACCRWARMTESEYSGPARHSPAADNIPEPTRVADEPQPPHPQAESPVDGTSTGVGSETDNLDEEESPQVAELRRLTTYFPMEKSDIQKLVTPYLSLVNPSRCPSSLRI
jgi:hypothetical protein